LLQQDSTFILAEVISTICRTKPSELELENILVDLMVSNSMTVRDAETIDCSHPGSIRELM
jgi:hypothetical protein